MSGKKWNEEQIYAIEDTGGSLLVSAAAGSGKTAVLVEKAVRIITQTEPQVPADSLLILTFTNAAAAQLRARIAARLEEEIVKNGRSVFLMRQRMRLARAFIGTIDAFCIQFVRENFAKLNIAPDVAVGEDAMLLVISEKALADTMEAMIDDEDFAGFCALYGRARSDMNAQQTVLALYEYTNSLPNAKDKLIQYTSMYESAAAPENTVWGEVLLQRLTVALTEAYSAGVQLLHSTKEEAVLAGCESAIKNDVQMLKSALSAAKNKHWNEVYALITAHVFLPFRPKRVKDVSEEQVLATAKTQRDLIKSITEELVKYTLVCTAEEYEEDRKFSVKYVAALCRAVQMYRDNYTEAKLAEHVLDFSDFEHMALGLLQSEDGGHSQLALRLAQKHTIVMVDEYQDTNELQSAIYELLGAYEGDNLFYVGDVKQSIYRFRMASPNLFLDKKKNWAPYATGRHPAHITLGKNYRSAQDLLGGINYLFERLMSDALGEVDYSEGERLIAGGTCPKDGKIELRIVRTDAEDGEATWVAQKICDMIQAKTPVWEGEKWRPCNCGDFCILMRAQSDMPLFLAALEKKGIAAAAANAGDLLESPQVIALCAVLAAIDNPGDDIQLASAMLGPLFRFTATELTALRAETAGGRLWGALCASKNKKAANFVRRMQELRVLAGALPLGQLCEVLVDDTGYRAAVGAMQGGAGRKEDLHRFIEWAAKVGTGGRGGLAAFVRLCKNGRGPAGSVVNMVASHVNIITIHKSKGLEFPFVFLCDAKRKFNLLDLTAKVQMHTRLGVGMALRNGDALYRTLQAAAIRAQNEAEALSEEMRLLYVALTRAKQRAIITFAAKEPEKLIAKKAIYQSECPGPFLLAREGSMADWILCALMSSPAMGKLLDAYGLKYTNSRTVGELFEVSIEEVPGEEKFENNIFELTHKPEATLLNSIRQSFALIPKRLQLAAVPTKLSVSQVTKRDTEYESIRKRPSFMYSGGLSAAEKGTALHSFMQYANLQAASRDIESEIERLVGGGFITGQAGDAVNREGVKRFFASALWQRVCNAKKVLREYDFITAIKATDLQEELDSEYDGEQVLVQGIADLVLVGDGEIEIVDYKTDRVKSGEELAQKYAPQITLYAMAIQKRLGLPANKLTIWSFALGEEVGLET